MRNSQNTNKYAQIIITTKLHAKITVTLSEIILYIVSYRYAYPNPISVVGCQCGFNTFYRIDSHFSFNKVSETLVQLWA